MSLPSRTNRLFEKTLHPYLTQSGFEVVLQKSTPPPIRLFILYILAIRAVWEAAEESERVRAAADEQVPVIAPPWEK